VTFECSGQVIGNKELPAVSDRSLSMHHICVTRLPHGVSGEHQHLAESMDPAACLQWNDGPIHNQRQPWCLWCSRSLPGSDFTLQLCLGI